MRVCLVVLSLLAFTGCVFNNMSSEETLRDSVVGLNDEVRWNRLDLATLRVAPGFKGHFRATHYDWHRTLQIADTEVVGVEVGDDRDHATSFVTVRWYGHDTMLLAETTLQQSWRRTLNGYLLIAEEVSEGNDRLLEVPERMREAVELETPEIETDTDEAESASSDTTQDA